MSPDLSFWNVPASAAGVLVIVLLAVRMVFPTLLPTWLDLRRILPATMALVFLTGTLRRVSPGLMDSFVFGALTGLALVVMASMGAIIYFGRFKLRAVQIREYVAVHKQLTRHRRD